MKNLGGKDWLVELVRIRITTLAKNVAKFEKKEQEDLMSTTWTKRLKVS